MHRRSLVALTALTTAIAGAVTPVASAAETLTPECQAQVEQAKQEHLEKVEAGGSSFVGPQELLKGIFAGYGSSGMPEQPECAQPEAVDPTKETLDKLPEEFWSSSDKEETYQGLTITAAVLGALAAVVQTMVVVANVNPAILNPLRDLLVQAGVRI